MIDAYDDIIVSYTVIGAIGTLFGFLLCFSPRFKQHEEEYAKESSNIQQHSDEKTPLVSTHDESREQADTATSSEAGDPLDKRGMQPALFWTITIIVAVLICMYTGIESSYGGLLATYATEVDATDPAGAAYMTSCTHIHA